MTVNRTVMTETEWLIELVSQPSFSLWEIPEAELSTPQQVFLRVWAVKGEVDNGGFEQFFFNSAGDRAPQTIEALREIGAHSTARVVEQACTLLGSKGPPPISEAPQAALAKIYPRAEAIWTRLEDEFYSDPDRLDRKLVEYVIENKDHFPGATELIARSSQTGTDGA
jgi:hypothetical protein